MELMMEVRSRAPGKVILCGEHAVVHGTTAVAASLGLYTHVHINMDPSKQDDGVSLNLEDFKMHLKWPIREIGNICEIIRREKLENDSSAECLSPDLLNILEHMVNGLSLPEAQSRAASGVTAFLYLYSCIIGPLAASVNVHSELPLGAGLGSSAAFCVSVSAALLTLAKKLEFEPKTQEPDHDCGDQSWLDISGKSLDLINKWAFEGERIIHGRPSGIDNTVSSYGRLVKFKKGQLTRIQRGFPLRMLLTDTKVGRNTKALVSSVAERTLRHPKAMAFVFDAVNALAEELGMIIEESGATLAGSEHQKRLEELIEMNQGLLQCMGVGHPSIDEICKTTSKFKLFSKLTGAGGGGCVLTLIPEELSTKVLLVVKEELEAQGYQCYETKIGCKGVQISLQPF